MKNKKTATTFAKRLIKIHNRNPAITSERRMQISTTALVTSVVAAVLVTGFFISFSIVTASAAAAKTTPTSGKTANNTSIAITSGTVLTLGNPTVIYTESLKSSAPSPVTLNGTHAQATAFTANGTLAGIPVTDTGTAYVVTRSDGSVYTFGNGAFVSKIGSGILIYTFDAIGHYLNDGKLYDTGHIIIKSTSGDLDSFSDKIGLYKDWNDPSGNSMLTMWFWRG